MVPVKNSLPPFQEPMRNALDVTDAGPVSAAEATWVPLR